jgi:hypothetical protein
MSVNSNQNLSTPKIILLEKMPYKNILPFYSKGYGHGETRPVLWVLCVSAFFVSNFKNCAGLRSRKEPQQRGSAMLALSRAIRRATDLVNQPRYCLRLVLFLV